MNSFAYFEIAVAKPWIGWKAVAYGPG